MAPSVFEKSLISSLHAKSSPKMNAADGISVILLKNVMPEIHVLEIHLKDIPLSLLSSSTILL